MKTFTVGELMAVTAEVLSSKQYDNILKDTSIPEDKMIATVREMVIDRMAMDIIEPAKNFVNRDAYGKVREMLVQSLTPRSFKAFFITMF